MLFIALFAGLASAAVLSDFGSPVDKPQSYIVEFDTSTNLNSSIQSRSSVLSASGVEVTGEYHENGIFVGAAVQVTSEQEISIIATAAGVISVYPVVYFDAPQPVPTDEPETQLSRRASAYSQLPTIQADKVHESGNRGAGVRIGVIDSGVDYYHPALGGGYGAGYKVAGGYDLVGSGYTGGTPQPEEYPYDECNGHGTLVAGLIAGSDNEYDSPGVAPDATIYAYKVFGCSGSTPDSVIIDAMLRAVSDGCDVINLSLGTATGWSTSASAIVASRISATGVQVVVSAGNGGVHGAFYPSSPAAGRGVLSAGAVQSSGTPIMGANAHFGDDSVYFTYTSIKPLLDGTFPLLVTGNTACSSIGDVAGKVVVVKRGDCPFATKVDNLKSNGAIAVIIYNNVDGAMPRPPTLSLPTETITAADGEALLSAYIDGATIDLGYIPDIDPNPTSNQMTYFSSIGPTFDMYGSPHIVAPGQNIFGPTPRAMGTWTVLSGTSFSAPLTTGAIALWVSARGRQGARNAVQSTAMPVPYTDGIESAASAGAGMLRIYDAINADTIVSPNELYLNDTQYRTGNRFIVVRNNGTETRTYNITHRPANTIYALDESSKYMSNSPEHLSSPAKVSFSMPTFTLRPNQTISVLFSITAPPSSPRIPIYSGYIELAGGSTPVRVTYLGVATRLRSAPIIEASPKYFGYNTPVLFIGGSSTASTSGRAYTFQNDDYPSILWRLLMGTTYLSIDLIDANQQFTPTYQRRGLADDVSPDDALDTFAFDEEIMDDAIEVFQSMGNPALRRRSRSRESEVCKKSNGRDPSCDICKISNGRDPSCRTSSQSQVDTYKAVPTIGNIYMGTMWTRSHNNAGGNEKHKGDSYYLRVTQPVFSNGRAIPNGSYRFIMRALKINGARASADDYESWLSPVFVVNRT